MEPADDEELEQRRRLVELVSAEAGTLIGAAAGAMVAGPAGALVGAGTGTMVQHVLKEALARQLGRANEAADVAADVAGLTAEELLRRILADERLLDLARRVFTVAAETALRARIRAAGTALGRAVRDDSAIDEERFIVDTLATFHVPHYRILQQLGQRYEGYGQERDAEGQEPIHGWSPAALRKHQPGLVPVLGPVISALASQDLARNTNVGRYSYTPGEDDRWVLTDFGRQLLARLLEADGSEEPEAPTQDPPDG
jgi:hypothetical protein